MGELCCYMITATSLLQILDTPGDLITNSSRFDASENVFFLLLYACLR
jgi:hypothetical protein